MLSVVEMRSIYIYIYLSVKLAFIMSKKRGKSSARAGGAKSKGKGKSKSKRGTGLQLDADAAKLKSPRTIHASARTPQGHSEELMFGGSHNNEYGDEDSIATMTLDTLLKGVKAVSASTPLLRVMVFGLDVQLRNVYIQHWIDLQNIQKKWLIKDSGDRYMRYYTVTTAVAHRKHIHLEVFDLMKPWKLHILPPSDVNVIVLPFTTDKDEAQRTRIEFGNTHTLM